MPKVAPTPPDNKSTPVYDDIKKQELRQGIYFGLITSIMTMVPFQVGIATTGNATAREVLNSIVSMTVADSMADSYGIYFSDRASDPDIKESGAIIAATTTFVTKIICQLFFIIPFFLVKGVTIPIIINCIWGLVVLLLATYRVAKIRGISKTIHMIKTTLFTGMIVAGSYYLTKYISGQKK